MALIKQYILFAVFVDTSVNTPSKTLNIASLINHKIPTWISFHKHAKGKKRCNVHLSCPRIIDSGASRHVCHTLQGLANHQKLSRREIVLRVRNGFQIFASAVGTFLLKLPQGETLDLKDCLYFASYIKNLIFVLALVKEDFSLTFNKMGCSLHQGSRLIRNGTMIDGLY